LKAAGINAFSVRFLEPAYWEAADVLIVPPLRDVRELTYQRALALRDWVAKGGKIILLSEACGYRAHANLFPEVSIVAGEQNIKALALAGTKIGIEARALTLKQQDGKIVGTANGNTIVVKGSVGKGTVIQCGVRVPVSDDAPEWASWQRLILALLKL
jgi:hypothetical protein